MNGSPDPSGKELADDIVRIVVIAIALILVLAVVQAQLVAVFGHAG